MNEYKIYQVVAPETDPGLFREYAFASLDAILWRHPGFRGEIPTLPRDAWELVYAYQTELEPSLDWLFALFNRGVADFAPDIITPEDFKGRSMSCSDIIETPDGRLWFCDSLGWQEVQWEETDCHTGVRAGSQ